MGSGRKQHWHSRLLGRTDRRKGNCSSSILSIHAPLLPTSRQPEPNKGTASGLVVVREPYLCRVALSVGLQVRGGGTGRSGSPSLVCTRTRTYTRRLGLGLWELPCRSGLVAMSTRQSRSANNTHHLRKATWEQGVSDEQAGRKQQSTKQQNKKLTAQRNDQDPSKPLDGQTWRS